MCSVIHKIFNEECILHLLSTKAIILIRLKIATPCSFINYAYISRRVCISNSKRFIIFYGDLFFFEHIIIVDSRLIESLIVSQDQAFDEVTLLILKKECVNSCALAKSLQDNAPLIDLFILPLVENGFLITKDK